MFPKAVILRTTLFGRGNMCAAIRRRWKRVVFAFPNGGMMAFGEQKVPEGLTVKARFQVGLWVCLTRGSPHRSTLLFTCRYTVRQEPDKLYRQRSLLLKH